MGKQNVRDREHEEQETLALRREEGERGDTEGARDGTKGWRERTEEKEMKWQEAPADSGIRHASQQNKSPAARKMNTVTMRFVLHPRGVETISRQKLKPRQTKQVKGPWPVSEAR